MPSKRAALKKTKLRIIVLPNFFFLAVEY